MGDGQYSGDGGPAVNASLYRPVDIAIDASGNLFIVAGTAVGSGNSAIFMVGVYGTVWNTNFSTHRY